jgi:hypothetical protein
MRKAFAIAAALLLSACETTPRVTTDFDPNANFSNYRTFEWANSAAPQGGNPLIFERVKSSVERSLAAKSFTTSSTPDFAVGITLGARDRVETTNWGPYLYPGYGRGFGRGWAYPYSSVDVRTVTDGTLSIDIFDARTKKPVWHGHAVKQISGSKIDQALIDEAVDAALANFPPVPKVSK